VCTLRTQVRHFVRFGECNFQTKRGAAKLAYSITSSASERSVGPRLGNNVRQLRRRRRLTQEQLAFQAEIDLTYVRGVEREKRNPSLLLMARIAEALWVSVPKLLSD
jgi:DNA-binding XRE family transcriptional regulator